MPPFVIQISRHVGQDEDFMANSWDSATELVKQHQTDPDVHRIVVVDEETNETKEEWVR